MSHALLLLARCPYPIDNGRKKVISTFIQSLLDSQRFSRIDCVIFDKEPNLDISTPPSVKLHFLGSPRWYIAALNALKTTLYRRESSLNEDLYWDKKKFKELSCITEERHKFIYVDMIRLAPYAQRLEHKFHLDMDDLLSSRYGLQSKKISINSPFGFGGSIFPSIFRPVINLISSRIFRREASLLSRRELYWATESFTCSLVSGDEARILSNLSNKFVHSVPMSVDIPDIPEIKDKPSNCISLVFMGSLDIPGNRASLSDFMEGYFPHLRKLNVKITVIGKISNDITDIPNHEKITQLGFITNPSKELSRHHYFLAHIMGGTGIKTKVLDALAAGLPILATPDALKGINKATRLVYKYDSPEELLSNLTSPLEDDKFIIQERRQFIRDNFSKESINPKIFKIINYHLA